MTTTYSAVAPFLKALAHPARLQIVDILRAGDVCVCHIEAALHKRQAYVSQQLMILREAGLVESRKDGLQVYYRLIDPKVVELLEIFGGFKNQVEQIRIDGCACPSCVAVSTILEKEIVPC